MTLIKSISGIRGTIGGAEGDNLTPADIVKFTSAYAAMVRKRTGKEKPVVVIGRDARISGPMVQALVSATLNAMGVDVIDAGLSTTPTVEMAVVMSGADAGIILTASHNPGEWNALKLLNEKGEFISAAEGELLLQLAEEEHVYTPVTNLGSVRADDSFLQKHIAAIITMSWVDVDAIRSANFRVALDPINSSGAIAMPLLFKALGVNYVFMIHGEPNGVFAHNPEPLPQHLTDLSKAVVSNNCHLGVSVDPDVDRLALVCEDGNMFGEEYTLVAVADYMLSAKPGATVSNLSSSRALRDVTEAKGGSYHASAVGEVNVVAMMKEVNAVIGGEGNGGIIVPDLHYGRDALAGIAIFLTHLAKSGKTMTALKASYPQYTMIKNKINLSADLNVDELLNQAALGFAHEQVNTTDGVKIDFANGWVHLRKSNTEPIVRVYAEATTSAEAQQLVAKVTDALGVVC